MADFVRVGEDLFACSLSQKELELLMVCLKAMCRGFDDGVLDPEMSGVRPVDAKDALEYFELVKWQAFGAYELDATLAPYFNKYIVED